LLVQGAQVALKDSAAGAAPGEVTREETVLSGEAAGAGGEARWPGGGLGQWELDR
jgi:hypothetical protein